MLEQILDLVKQQGQQSVVQNTEVPNERNNEVMMEAASTITGGLQNMLSGGGLQNIISMFSGDQSQGRNGILSNPVTSMMVGHLANNLMKKMNLSPAVANTVANNIIPGVLNSLVSNTRSNDPANAGFNLNSLIGELTGGSKAAPQTNGIDFQGLIGQLGADTNGDGKVDFSDIIGAVSRQSQSQQQTQRESGGGIADLIQGFFK